MSQTVRKSMRLRLSAPRQSAPLRHCPRGDWLSADSPHTESRPACPSSPQRIAAAMAVVSVRQFVRWVPSTLRAPKKQKKTAVSPALPASPPVHRRRERFVGLPILWPPKGLQPNVRPAKSLSGLSGRTLNKEQKSQRNRFLWFLKNYCVKNVCHTSRMTNELIPTSSNRTLQSLFAISMKE